jgi:LysR family transcriptional regulator, cyn operon transcriptional activator
VRALRAGPIEEQLLRGELDLGIGFHPTVHEEIETEPLFDERLMLALHPRHRLSPQSACALQALAGVPLALLSRAYATRRQIDEQFRLAGVAPVVAVEMESVEALLQVCHWSEDLAAIVPERAALQVPGLHVAVLDAPGLVRSAGLLWRRGASRSTAAREFARRLHEAGPAAAAAAMT